MEKSVVEVLVKPFNKSEIKERQGSFGKTLSYIEGHAVIRRLNNAFEHNWSFEITDRLITEGHLVVTGRLKVQVGADTIVKDAFGGKKLTKTKAYPDKPSEFLDVASDFKAASTDALKKAATLLGVGLDLYGADESDDDSEDSHSKDTKERAKESVSKGAEEDTSKNPATMEQRSAVEKLSKVKKANLPALLSEISVDKLESLTQAQAKTLITKLNNQ